MYRAGPQIFPERGNNFQISNVPDRKSLRNGNGPVTAPQALGRTMPVPLNINLGVIDFMNTDQMSGKWKQMKGAAKQQWGKLTDDDLEVIAGRREALVGKLQERYGMAKEDAQHKADEWLRTYKFDEKPVPAAAGTLRTQ